MRFSAGTGSAAPARAIAPAGGGQPDLRLEAAQFALDQAGSPVEFADYLRTFIDLMRNFDDPFESPEERYEQAERAVYTLGPLMFATLD